MAIHRERRAVAQPAETFFEFVADVERYPEFLPLMRRARIVSRHAQGYETEQSLADIAYAIGFSSQSYFSQRFRQIKGLSPLQFRKQFKH